MPSTAARACKGKPVTYDVEWKKLVLEKLDEKPPNKLARWDGPTLAAELGTSEDAVQQSFIISTLRVHFTNKKQKNHAASLDKSLILAPRN